MKEFNKRFTVPAAQRGHAFLPVGGKNPELTFSLHLNGVWAGYRVTGPPAFGWILEHRLRASLRGAL